jgi:hypothetical protein
LRPIDTVDRLEVALGQVQNDLERVRQDRRQERFIWIGALVAVLIPTMFAIGGVAGGIAFMLLAVVLLIVAARVLEVPWAVSYLERILNKYDKAEPGETE